MKKRFIIKLPNGDLLFTKYKSWSDLTRILPYLCGNLKDIKAIEVNFWNYLKKLLTSK